MNNSNNNDDSNNNGNNSNNNNNNNNNNNKSKNIFQGAECALQLHALDEYISKIFECHSMARAISGRRDIKHGCTLRI